MDSRSTNKKIGDVKMDNLMGFLSTEATAQLREITGCDEINDKLKSYREIENKILDLWLGGFIRHFEARKALEILRQKIKEV